eukprot:COSAG01_NODE_16769_length_1206_cov_1.967480_3_plen_205_part_01
MYVYCTVGLANSQSFLDAEHSSSPCEQPQHRLHERRYERRHTQIIQQHQNTRAPIIVAAQISSYASLGSFEHAALHLSPPDMVLNLPVPSFTCVHLFSVESQFHDGGGAQLLSLTHAAKVLNFPVPSFTSIHLPSVGLSQFHDGGGAQLLSSTHAAKVLNFPLPSFTSVHLPSVGLWQFHVAERQPRYTGCTPYTYPCRSPMYTV